jgi:hypothetical protein
MADEVITGAIRRHITKNSAIALCKEKSLKGLEAEKQS